MIKLITFAGIMVDSEVVCFRTSQYGTSFIFWSTKIVLFIVIGNLSKDGHLCINEAYVKTWATLSELHDDLLTNLTRFHFQLSLIGQSVIATFFRYGDTNIYEMKILVHPPMELRLFLPLFFY